MSSTSFITILDRHFKMNQDYLLDHFQDLIISEQELYTTLSASQSSSDSTFPAKMRKKLVEWMVQLCDELKLGYKTKQMAIILIDLALAKLKIHKNFLQLLGITCIFISIKSEESFIYTLAHACEHCGNTYTKEEISAMEMLVFKALKWKIHYPTPGEIARRLVHLTGASTVVNMPKFFKKIDNFIDLSLSEHDLTEYSPTVIAAASIMCAFGSMQNYAKEWRDLMISNSVIELNFDAIDCLYKINIQMLLKYHPNYLGAEPNEQSTDNISQQEALQQSTQATFTDSQMTIDYVQEMSAMSLGSQETYIEPTGGEVVLESFSHTGTPVNTKEMNASLLDTEKLYKSGFNTIENEGNEELNGESGMDEEKSY